MNGWCSLFLEKSAKALHKSYSEPFLGDPKPSSKHKMHCSHIFLESGKSEKNSAWSLLSRFSQELGDLRDLCIQRLWNLDSNKKKFNWKNKKFEYILVEELTKGFSTIPISGWSKLAARSLHSRLEGSSLFYIFYIFYIFLAA